MTSTSKRRNDNSKIYARLKPNGSLASFIHVDPDTLLEVSEEKFADLVRPEMDSGLVASGDKVED